MNARQKAKKYKRMYEALLKEPARVKVEVEHHKIDTLRLKQFYPDSFLAQEDSDFVQEIISHDIARSLTSSLEKYITYTTEFCPSMNSYCISGEIKVVCRK